MKIDAMMEGDEAYFNGVALEATPYDLDTQEVSHFEWNDGWEAAAESQE